MNFKRRIYYKLSPKARFLVRRIFFLPIDLWKTLFGKRHKYEPPKGFIYTGSENFIEQGKRHLELLKRHLNLKSDDAVLDVGSGIGRTAIALTGYLNSKGRYEGFDVVKKGVNWCNKKIKKDFPNFNFIYVPLYNDLYNSSKNGDAQKFKFPYKDHEFDKVFLFSVFTHMSVKEIANYLCEIKRVLKPEGMCLSTFFIYNSKNENDIVADIPYAFPIKMSNYRLMSDKVKSANIALNEDLLDELIDYAKLKKLKTIEGSWKYDKTDPPASARLQRVPSMLRNYIKAILEIRVAFVF